MEDKSYTYEEVKQIVEQLEQVKDPKGGTFFTAVEVHAGPVYWDITLRNEIGSGIITLWRAN